MEPIYVSSVKGAVVGRLGTGTNIGVRRVPPAENGQKTTLEWDEGAVVKIPGAEYAQHRRHYDRAFTDETLIKRTEADYKAAQARMEAASKRRGEAKQAARKKLLEVEKRAAATVAAASDESARTTGDDTEEGTDR